LNDIEDIPWAKPYCFGLDKINSQSSTFWKCIKHI
jgi:hypothetical protein